MDQYTITTSKEGKLNKGPDPEAAEATGAAKKGGQQSEVYADKIAQQIGPSGTVSTFQYGNAIGNTGAHGVGHNLGMGHADRPPAGTAADNVMTGGKGQDLTSETHCAS